MTISSTNNRESFAGNGVTTVFSFPNKFLKDTDLVVILKTDLTGVEVLQVITTNYTVSGAGADAGGSVTMIVAPPTGKSLVILRDPALIQDTDLRENDSLPAESVEDEFDRSRLIDQRLDDLISRSVVLPDGFTATFNTDLPGLLPADTVVAVGPAADKFVTGPTITDIANAAANAAAAAASAAAAAVSETNAATSETNAAASAATINIDVAVANKRGTLIAQNAADDGFERLPLGTINQILNSKGDDALPVYENFGKFLAAANKFGALLVQNDADDAFELLSGQGTLGQALISQGADALPIFQAVPGSKVAHLKHSVSSGTAGGASTTTTYVKRTINVEEDPDGILTVSSSVITLSAAGEYIICIRTLINSSGGDARTKLRNTSDSTDDILGLTVDPNAGISANFLSNAYGRVSIAGAKDFEIQTKVQTGVATNGFGLPITFGDAEEYVNMTVILLP